MRAYHVWSPWAHPNFCRASVWPTEGSPTPIWVRANNFDFQNQNQNQNWHGHPRDVGKDSEECSEGLKSAPSKRKINDTIYGTGAIFKHRTINRIISQRYRRCGRSCLRPQQLRWGDLFQYKYNPFFWGVDTAVSHFRCVSGWVLYSTNNHERSRVAIESETRFRIIGVIRGVENRPAIKRSDLGRQKVQLTHSRRPAQNQSVKLYLFSIHYSLHHTLQNQWA